MGGKNAKTTARRTPKQRAAAKRNIRKAQTRPSAASVEPRIMLIGPRASCALMIERIQMRV